MVTITTQHIDGNDFIDRVKEKGNFATDAELSRYLGMTRASVHFARARNTISKNWISTLASRGWRIEWLLTGEGEPFQANAVINAGEPYERLSIHREIGQDKNRAARVYGLDRGVLNDYKIEADYLSLVEATDEDMEPRIHIGDTVMVNTKNPKLDKGFLCLKVRNAFVFRDVIPSLHGLKVKSNLTEDLIRETTTLDVEVIGKVVGVIRFFN